MSKFKNIFYPACVFLAGILWGTSGLFVRTLESAGCSMFEICFFRMVSASLILTIVFAIVKPSVFKIKLKDIWIFACAGILSIYGTSFTYFTAIEKSSMSFACIMMYTAPIFVAIFAKVLFKEKITPLKLICLIITFIGCILCAYKKGGFSAEIPVILIGLASGVTYASYTIFSRIAMNKGYESQTILCYSMIFSALGSLLTAPYGDVVNHISNGSVNPLTILGLGVLVTALPYLAYTVGLKGVDSGKASVISCVEIVSATLLGFIAFSETPQIVAYVGMALVFVGVVLMNVNFKKKDNESLSLQ
jgi:drug/metabolite transporter (DMT)-like permease